MCKVLENRSQQDEERMDQLTNQLKEARLLAEDADGKSDEVSRKLAFVEDELEVAEDRVKSGEAKIMELEEELKVCYHPKLIVMESYRYWSKLGCWKLIEIIGSVWRKGQPTSGRIQTPIEIIDH